MRTRPCKPVSLHLAEGTFRPGRHAKVSATSGIQLEAVPPPRDSLQENGKAKWHSIGEILQARGLLQGRYLDALEMLCRAYDRAASYQATLSEAGEFYTTARGVVVAHPAVRLLATARDEIRRYLIEFGMTPSSSNGIDLPPAAPHRGVPNRGKDLS